MVEIACRRCVRIFYLCLYPNSNVRFFLHVYLYSYSYVYISSYVYVCNCFAALITNVSPPNHKLWPVIKGGGVRALTGVATRRYKSLEDYKRYVEIRSNQPLNDALIQWVRPPIWAPLKLGLAPFKLALAPFPLVFHESGRISICAYIYTYTYLYMYMHVYLPVYIYTKTYIHIYVYIYIYVFLSTFVCMSICIC